MADLNKEKTGMFGGGVDVYNMVRDILKAKWIILMLSIAMALLTYVWTVRNYSPVYTVEGSYVVTAKGMGNDIYSNLSTASNAATQFSTIINSSTLQKSVAEELGTGGIPGSVTASIVESTNILNLRAKASSPRMAYRILKAVMNNYKNLTDYMISNAVLEVLIPASIPTQPDNPMDVERKMVIVFVLALIALIALTGAISYLKDTIRRSTDVEEKLDAKLLGALGHERKRRSILARLRGKKPALLVSSKTISFQYVENLQKIVKKIQNQMEVNDGKVLMVSSYAENEGKSTVAANIALTLAQNNKRTVLVDLDLKQPAQYKIFDLGHKADTTFVDALKGKETSGQLLNKLEKENLYTIFNTKSCSGSIQLITGGVLDQILDYLREYFDYIILDTPPMAATADAAEIANYADASLLVVREHTSHTRDINDMIEELGETKTEFIGCIFNDAHKVRSGSGYGYGYGYGYGKGRYGRYGKYGKYGSYGKYGTYASKRKNEE